MPIEKSEVCYSVGMSLPPLPIDLGFSHAIQQFQPNWLSVLMRGVSNVIDPAVLCMVGVVMVAYLILRKHDERTVLLIALLTLGNVLTPLLKLFFTRPRPSSELVHIVARETGYSFPSGHAVAVVLLGGTIALLIQRLAKHHQRLWLAMVTLMMLLVGYSRVYLGVHWLSDVLFGYIVGLAWIVFIAHVTRSKLGPKRS